MFGFDTDLLIQATYLVTAALFILGLKRMSSPVTARGGPEAGEAGETPPPMEDILWTRANLRELLPDLPSPLFASISERIDWAANNRRLGMDVRPGDRMIRFIQGRPYFNLSLITRWMEEFGFPASQFRVKFTNDVSPNSVSDGCDGTTTCTR